MSGVLIGLLGVIVGALITGIKEYISYTITRRKRGEYLAIRVVSILDNFVSQCTSVVLDNGLCYGQRDEEGCLSVQVKTPDFSIDSLDVDWKSIPSNLMYEILSISNQVKSANEEINVVYKYIAGPPDYEELFDERQIQYANLGLNAASLADRLRKLYKIPLREYNDWNPTQSMSEGKERALARKNRRSIQSKTFQEQLLESD